MTPPNFMVIGLQIGKLHIGVESIPPALPDSEKPGLFRVKDGYLMPKTYAEPTDAHKYLGPSSCFPKKVTTAIPRLTLG